MTEEDKVEKLAERLHEIWSNSFECIKSRTHAYYTHIICQNYNIKPYGFYNPYNKGEKEKYFNNIDLFRNNLKQSNTPYSKLSETDKEKDRVLARELLKLMEE